MFQPSSCPDWEYSDHPDKHVLVNRSENVLLSLRAGSVDFVSTSRNTKSVHNILFSGLTPPGFDYYAGNYRGEDFPCLKLCRVYIRSDSRVGCDPKDVGKAMRVLSDRLKEGFSILDSVLKKEGGIYTPDSILRIIKVACSCFVTFLTIHPYVNGNGHMARYMIWSFLGKYGFWPKQWPLDGRPPDPPYSKLIAEYRDGNKEALERFVLSCLLGTA